MPYIRTRLFDSEYIVKIYPELKDHFCMELTITMNDVVVERKFVKPDAILHPEKYLMNWFLSRYGREVRSLELVICE